jgi:hypothetical protein
VLLLLLLLLKKSYGARAFLIQDRCPVTFASEQLKRASDMLQVLVCVVSAVVKAFVIGSGCAYVGDNFRVAGRQADIQAGPFLSQNM